jgi:hypothetical protein
MDALPTQEPDENPGWRTVIGYGVVSALMVLLAVAAYTNYLSQQRAQATLEYERARMTRALTDELRTVLEKQDSLQRAREQVAILGREIAALPTVPAPDKARLAGTIDTIDGQLNTSQSLLDQAKGIISQFQAQRFARNSPFSLLQSAFADTPNPSPTPPEVRIGVAIAALLVIVVVISYCLWMIARPTVKAADKTWAKELLNKQLVFLGGLVVGIVVK